MGKSYRRYLTRLRFELGAYIPQVGDSWTAKTVLGGAAKRVHLLEVRALFEHPREPGVMLMDAKISTSDPR